MEFALGPKNAIHHRKHPDKVVANIKHTDKARKILIYLSIWENEKNSYGYHSISQLTHGEE